MAELLKTINVVMPYCDISNAFERANRRAEESVMKLILDAQNGQAESQAVCDDNDIFYGHCFNGPLRITVNLARIDRVAHRMDDSTEYVYTFAVEYGF